MNRLRALEGFSLVELLIVMAIAALIMIMVFIGFAQGNRDRRDDARKADAARYLEAERLWVTDHNGIPPTSANFDTPIDPNVAASGGIMERYIIQGNAKFANPDGVAWTVAWRTPGVGNGPNTPASASQMLVGAGSTCNGTNIADGGPRQFAVMLQLEGGGYYCITN